MHRPATIQDVSFIYDLILDGSKNGYFNRAFCQVTGASNGLFVELTSIIAEKIRPNGLQAEALIYEHKGRSVGFIIMSAGENNKGNELWMAAIHPDHRGKGHGKAMITWVLDQFEGKNHLLFARCAPESEIMYQLLLSHGFSHMVTGDEGYRGLIYEP